MGGNPGKQKWAQIKVLFLYIDSVPGVKFCQSSISNFAFKKYGQEKKRRAHHPNLSYQLLQMEKIECFTAMSDLLEITQEVEYVGLGYMRNILNFLREDDKVIKAEINLESLAGIEDPTAQPDQP